ncbi:condensation domain-containing protein, partial [Nitrosospira sp. NpAV]|uniref:condensation domain-containing protein n=1 Tax=Nitrosospira sp. NpAV TaxID=58133 RepID=UPI0012EC87F1
QTIAALAAVVIPAEGLAETIQKNTGIISKGASSLVPLLPIQIEFFEQEIPARHHWNQAVLLKSSQLLDIECLAQALEAVVRHHDALRFRYVKQSAGDWQQICGEPAIQSLQGQPWVRHAANAEQFEALCNEAQRSLNLTDGPLLRALVIEMVDGTQRLLLIIHHLVVDGVSWRILLEDLQNAYDQYRTGAPITLPEKTSGYPMWAQRLQTYAQSHGDELPYWQGLTDIPVSLPRDYPQGLNNHQASMILKLDRMQTQALLKQAPAAYRTQVNDLLLTALGSALCRWSGHEKILVDLEGHGREDLYADIDLSQTVGWFTSLYPVTLDPSGDLDQRLKRIKQSLRQIPNKGLGYGLFKYHGTPEQRRALACVPKAEVVFNYLGQFDASFDEASWTLAIEPAGDLMDAAVAPSHDISINSHVYAGELSLEVSYSQTRYAKATIESFVKDYQAELEGLIIHCTSGICGTTPSDFPLIQVTQDELDGLPIPAEQLDDLYPLSPMQSGMLFHSVYDSDGSLYVNQLRADVEGLYVGRFKAAWQAAVDRHDVLRTGFLHQRDVPLQWVARAIELPLAEYDWRDPSSRQSVNQERDLQALAQSEHARGFDLAQPPLMRLALVRLANKKYHFIWTIHHLLLDGWSASQLMSEVLQRYGGTKLPPSAGRYRNYIEWLQSRDMHASEAHWRKQLRGMGEPTRLADAFPTHGEDARYDEYTSVIERTTTAGLIDFAKRERVTVNTLIQAAWALLLNRYTCQPAVAFGVTIAGRPDDLPGADRLLGLFINTLPVIAMLDPEQEIAAWLRELQAQNLSLREHGHTPLYEIQRWGRQSGQGLFDSILVFENYPMDEALQQFASSELVFSAVRSREVTNYALTVSVTQADTLNLQYGYSSKDFSEIEISRIAAQMERLLHEIVQGSGRILGDIDILSGEEKAQLKAWGVNEQRYADAEPVHRLIERQVEACPEAVALIFGDTELSYAELNRRANRLAHRLIALGVGPETRVGIAVERSLEMIVGLLAILKAGGAYVPLDPEYPQERLNYMVTDSGIGLLLTQSHIRARIPHAAQCAVLELDTVDVSGEAVGNPAVGVHGDNLVYVIYTSGSTGKPKGVGLAHHALAKHAQAAVGFFGLSAADRMLLFSTIN